MESIAYHVAMGISKHRTLTISFTRVKAAVMLFLIAHSAVALISVLNVRQAITYLQLEINANNPDCF